MNPYIASMILVSLIGLGAGCVSNTNGTSPSAVVVTLHDRARGTSGGPRDSVADLIAHIDSNVTAMGLKDYADIVQGFKTGDLLGYEVIDSRVEGDCALVLVLYRMTRGKQFDPEDLKMLRQQGAWKFVPFNVPEKMLSEQQRHDFRLLYQWTHGAWQTCFAERHIIP